jgi:hypothetical protein
VSIALYMDHHVPKVITESLRLRDVDVVTAYEDEAHELDDAALLERATELKRVLFPQDDDLLVEATKRQRSGRYFSGVIYAHQLNISIGDCVTNLELIAKAGEMKDIENKVEYLPL